jgi:hypothetical protein
MIYRIVVCSGDGSGIDIYGPDAEMAVLDPHLEIELNSAGTLEFTLPVDNINWNIPNVFQNEIEVWEDDKIIWFGRPLQIIRDWNNQRRVICEGALSYFNDTIQRTWEQQPATNKTNISFFKHLISVHNNDTDNNKHFTEGEITIESVPAYRKTDYETTLDCLQNMCLSTDGGYFILRKEYNFDPSSQKDVATRYIDWYENLPENSMQDVQFGYNLLDITQDLNGADICTVLIPSGKDDVMLNTLGNKNEDDVVHNSGSDEIYYQPGVEVYGRVIQQKSWNDYRDVNEVWRKAKEWLIDKNTDIPTIECSAADLYYITDPSMPVEGPLQVGMNVQVVSAPHDFNKKLMMYKISMDLDSGIKKVTLGTPPKKELTDIIAPSSGGNSTSGNGGKGGGSGESGSGSGSGQTVIAPVQDVKVKMPGKTEYSSAVKKKVAKIDLTNVGKVDDVKVDGSSVVDNNKVANISIPVTDVLVDGNSVVDNKKANISVPVKDVKTGETSIVDEHGVAHVDNIVKVNERQGFGINSRNEIEYAHEFIRDLYINKHMLHYSSFQSDTYDNLINLNLKSGRNARFRVGSAQADGDFYTTDIYVDAISPTEPDIMQLMYDTSAHEPFYENVQSGYVADKVEYIIDSTGVYGIQMLGMKLNWLSDYAIYVVIESTRYETITPIGTENPSEEKWYIMSSRLDGDHYILSSDTTVVSGQTYYKLSPNYIFYRNIINDNNKSFSHFSLIKLYQGDKVIFVWNHDNSYNDGYVLRSIFKINNINTTEYDILSEDTLLTYQGRNYNVSTTYANKLILAVESIISIPRNESSLHGFNISNSYLGFPYSGNPEYHDAFVSLGIHDGIETEKLSGYFNNAVMYGIDNNPGTYSSVNLYQYLNCQESTGPLDFLGARFVIAFPPYESGGGGGTDIEPNPTGRPTSSLKTVRIGNTVYSIPGDIEANPSGEAVAVLNKIRIGNVIYKMPVTIDELYDACVYNGVTPAGRTINDIVAVFLEGGGGGGGVNVISRATSSSVPSGNADILVSATAQIITDAQKEVI